MDADDCYQETWLAALRAYPRLRDASNLKGWILTVAHRKAIDHTRARSRRPVPVPDTDPYDTATAAPADPALTPGHDDDIWAHVARLPDKQRTAVTMRYLVEAAYADIAAAMDTSSEAARRNVHEGLKRLREEYQP